jgi:hypothetical protein
LWRIARERTCEAALDALDALGSRHNAHDRVPILQRPLHHARGAP